MTAPSGLDDLDMARLASARRSGQSPVVVLGMFETGLGVGRSLGRAGIQVLGLDHVRKVGFRSRYIQASLCPHPIEREPEFIASLVRLGSRFPHPSVLMVTSDEFLLPVSRNREVLSTVFHLNLPAPAILESIADKYLQTELAERAGIATPRTFVARNRDELAAVREDVPFPAFIKGVEVTEWRRAMGDAVKGFRVRSPGEMDRVFDTIFERRASGLIQEIIPGPDTSHYKSSCYFSREGEPLLAFGLQKLRQQPVGFGFGCLVQSVDYPEMVALGKEFFARIGYRGVGSVEFKLDARDGRLKLIELNPRFWQQNALADRCGMNFPLMAYLDLIGANPAPVPRYRAGVKWVNLVKDFESFREYRDQDGMSLGQWLRSLRGETVLSDLSWDDPLPGLHELVVHQFARRIVRQIRGGRRG